MGSMRMDYPRSEKCSYDAVTFNSRRAEFRSIETALIAQRYALDCRLLERRRRDEEPCVVAFFVRADEADPVAMREFVRSRIQPDSLPVLWVPMTALPVDEAGIVDERRLASMPVFEDSSV